MRETRAVTGGGLYPSRRGGARGVTLTGATAIAYPRPVHLKPLLVALSLVASCRQSGESARGSTAPADAGSSVQGPAAILHPQGRAPVTVRLEVVRTPAPRERGLMFRRELGANDGMLFVFPRPEHQVFWMRNTLIPLDMIFIRADRTVLGVVRNATPETDDPRQVPGDSLYVLEVNGGQCDRWGLRAGDAVDLVGVQPAFE